MNLEILFCRTILVKNLMLMLIIAWGGWVQITNSNELNAGALTDVGGLLFILFSIAYFITSYYLYKFNTIGKKFFLPMVGTFIILGFLTELINASQFPKDIFYLFIFYIISPTFFVSQGVIISLVYFSDIKNKFF